MRDLPYQGFNPATSTEPLLAETFEDDRRAGTVIGSRSPNGVRRLGVDRERRMAIDHGALRFQPLITPGWARQGIAYGPFPREAGLALAVAQLQVVARGVLPWRFVTAVQERFGKLPLKSPAG